MFDAILRCIDVADAEGINRFDLLGAKAELAAMRTLYDAAKLASKYDHVARMDDALAAISKLSTPEPLR